jgi:RNA polymerase sigma factor (sigma-70 family)
MVVLAEPVTDSELVIEKLSKTTHTEADVEITLIQQVWARTALLRTKRLNFTPAEYRVKLQGEHALETLLKTHNNRICALVLEYQPKEGGADADLKQEAIAAFIESIQTFNPDKGAKLSTHAYIQIRSRLQTLTGQENRHRIARAKALFEPEASEPPEPVDHPEQERLNKAITELSETEQQVIRLRAQDIPFAEIAALLKRSIKRVQNLFYEARRQLRTLLGLQIEPIAENPETIEPIAEDVTAQKDFEKKRVVFGVEPITNTNPSQSERFVFIDRIIGAIRSVLRPQKAVSPQPGGFMIPRGP